jgi:hypothetical protein
VAVLAAAAGLSALLLLARSVENSADFSRSLPWILLGNIFAVVVLAALLARKLWQLWRDFRDHAGFAPDRPHRRHDRRPGGAPLLVVYLFSLEFLNRGIDSWFQVEIRQGLNDALVRRDRRSTCACANRRGAPRASRARSPACRVASCCRLPMKSVVAWRRPRSSSTRHPVVRSPSAAARRRRCYPACHPPTYCCRSPPAQLRQPATPQRRSLHDYYGSARIAQHQYAGGSL